MTAQLTREASNSASSAALGLFGALASRLTCTVGILHLQAEVVQAEARTVASESITGVSSSHQPGHLKAIRTSLYIRLVMS